MRALHALRVLYGESGYRGHAVTIVRGNRFQIGGNTRAAGRIESPDGQYDGRGWVRMVVHLFGAFGSQTLLQAIVIAISFSLRV